MVLVQGIIALITRQASKLLNTAFGWATMMLFGKVPQDKQLTLSAISFGSVLWLVVLLGIAFPAVGVFLLSFVPIPGWVDRTYVRTGMLIAAVVIPLLVGVLSNRIAAASPDGKHPGGLAGVLRGFPITLGLALTLAMLTVFAPIMKLRQMARRWTTMHVPVIVKPQHYGAVVGRVQAALATDGMQTERAQASWLIRVPTKVLTFLAGRSFASFVADELTVLTSRDFEVMIHPADMVISGKQQDVTRSRIVVSERLVFTEANLCWTQEATELEDKLTALWNEMVAREVEFATTLAPARLQAIQDQIHETPLPYEEWEVLARAASRIDQAILALAAGVIRQPKEVEEMNGKALAAKIWPEDRVAREHNIVKAVAVGGIGLLAILARKMPEAREALSPGNLMAIARMFIRP